MYLVFSASSSARTFATKGRKPSTIRPRLSFMALRSLRDSSPANGSTCAKYVYASVHIASRFSSRAKVRTLASSTRKHCFTSWNSTSTLHRQK